ncbi:MAG: glycerophosphoryl diester phosphodiesterase membrane domain-containing protein [Propionibacteriaceae bacterium]|jgi:hypothetical protein|nr:glycerophosphoryl diester phosphodiesterase membrane domain-containing protein [Propionibacteriaceae bacterium]
MRYSPAVTLGLTALTVVVLNLVCNGALYLLGLPLWDTAAMEAFEEVFGTGLAFTTSEQIVASLVTSVCSISISLAVFSAVRGKPTKPLDALRLIGRRVWLVLAYQLLLIAAMVVAVLALTFGVLIPSVGDSDPEAVVALIVLALILGIPLFYFLNIKLTLVVPVLSLESGGPFRAIARSWKLTRKSFWRVFGVLFVTGLIVSIASSTMSGVVALGQMAFDAEDPVVLLVSSTVSSVLTSTLTVPLTASVTALLYVDCRIRREGLDVQLMEEMYQ